MCSRGCCDRLKFGNVRVKVVGWIFSSSFAPFLSRSLHDESLWSGFFNKGRCKQCCNRLVSLRTICYPGNFLAWRRLWKSQLRNRNRYYHSPVQCGIIIELFTDKNTLFWSVNRALCQTSPNKIQPPTCTRTFPNLNLSQQPLEHILPQHSIMFHPFYHLLF